jgi:proteasome activator-like protein
MTGTPHDQDPNLPRMMSAEDEETDGPRVVVVGPGGGVAGGMATAQVNTDDGAEPDDATSIADMVEQPAKVMRIGSMIKQLLEEVRGAPLDEASRRRLKAIHASSITELEQGLAPELREELERLSLPFTEDEVPTEAELRVVQAQLVGWLEGVFHGIQTALFAQQMAARAQLEQMRRALPPGSMPPGMEQQQRGSGNTGPYL